HRPGDRAAGHSIGLILEEPAVLDRRARLVDPYGSGLAGSTAGERDAAESGVAPLSAEERRCEVEVLAINDAAGRITRGRLHEHALAPEVEGTVARTTIGAGHQFDHIPGAGGIQRKLNGRVVSGSIRGDRKRRGESFGCESEG